MIYPRVKEYTELPFSIDSNTPCNPTCPDSLSYNVLSTNCNPHGEPTQHLLTISNSAFLRRDVSRCRAEKSTCICWLRFLEIFANIHSNQKSEKQKYQLSKAISTDQGEYMTDQTHQEAYQRNDIQLPSTSQSLPSHNSILLTPKPPSSQKTDKHSSSQKQRSQRLC
jgi:hypothetical protein